MNPLKNLGIDDLHSGVSTGTDWLEGDGPLNESVSPIDGKPIAKIRTASKNDYEIAVQAAQNAFPTGVRCLRQEEEKLCVKSEMRFVRGKKI